MMVVLTGCGQTGPLTLPPQPNQPAQPVQDQKNDLFPGKKVVDRETFNTTTS